MIHLRVLRLGHTADSCEQLAEKMFNLHTRHRYTTFCVSVCSSSNCRSSCLISSLVRGLKKRHQTSHHKFMELSDYLFLLYCFRGHFHNPLSWKHLSTLITWQMMLCFLSFSSRKRLECSSWKHMLYMELTSCSINTATSVPTQLIASTCRCKWVWPLLLLSATGSLSKSRAQPFSD